MNIWSLHTIIPNANFYMVNFDSLFSIGHAFLWKPVLGFDGITGFQPRI